MHALLNYFFLLSAAYNSVEWALMMHYTLVL